MEKQDDKPQSTQDQGLLTTAAKKVGELAGTVAASLGLGQPSEGAKPSDHGVESGIKRPRTGKSANRRKAPQKPSKTPAKKGTSGLSRAKRSDTNAVVRKPATKTTKKSPSASKRSRRPSR